MNEKERETHRQREKDFPIKNERDFGPKSNNNISIDTHTRVYMYMNTYKCLNQTSFSS